MNNNSERKNGAYCYCPRYLQNSNIPLIEEACSLKLTKFVIHEYTQVSI